MSSDIVGYIDRVEKHLVEGWAYSSEQPASELPVRILKSGVEVAKGKTQDTRPDVHLRNSAVKRPGFVLKVPDDELALAEVRVEALSPMDGTWHALKLAASAPTDFPRGYQSFLNSPGDSPSYQKLASLQLNKVLDRKRVVGESGILSGLRVLDVGCNEGFFCQACSEQGAVEVVGIDLNPEVVIRAKARFPHLTFKHMSWWDLGPEQFDVILFLSAVHYEVDQRKLMEFLRERLRPDGTLVLECGVAPGAHNTDRAWTFISRHDQDLRYPTLDYLRNTLLRRYAVRLVGPSANQPGDPMPRFVFHANPRRPIALIISGQSFSGKTILATTLSLRHVPSYSIDDLLVRMIERPELYSRSIIASELQRHSIGAESLEKATNIIASRGLETELTEKVTQELPLDEEVFTIEGEALTNSIIRMNLKLRLDGLGVMVWHVTTEPNA